ncbi:MAG: hypothetical protein K0Q90_3665 [Paenibacillaceae bacterium]|nr:hypothetical protein [Paenibacillaceae bacterium]
MYIDILILSQLMHSPKHGYEIKKNVAFLLGKSNTINNNYLYPTLKRFEEMGAITKQLELQENRPNRHIYSITETGKEFFYSLLNEFPPEFARNQDEIFNRLAFFELLEQETREQVISGRIRYIEENLAHIEGLVHSLEDNRFLPMSPIMHEYSKLQMKAELDFFTRLKERSEICKDPE